MGLPSYPDRPDLLNQTVTLLLFSLGLPTLSRLVSPPHPDRDTPLFHLGLQSHRDRYPPHPDREPPFILSGFCPLIQTGLPSSPRQGTPFHFVWVLPSHSDRHPPHPDRDTPFHSVWVSLSSRQAHLPHPNRDIPFHLFEFALSSRRPDRPPHLLTQTGPLPFIMSGFVFSPRQPPPTHPDKQGNPSSLIRQRHSSPPPIQNTHHLLKHRKQL